MHSLTNKRILLGVTGGIAAYKSAELLRLLQQAGAVVRVVMTKGAQEFITPLTMQALSGLPVHTNLLDSSAEAAMGHIELSRWADVILIAPASANTLSKLVAGEASDLLTTLCLASASELVIAPAMNQGMWNNPSTQQNIKTLLSRKVRIFGPDSGVQACGDVGPGRMLAPSLIAEHLAEIFPSSILSGKRVVITAGPTREAIDPVRYISNHSSGKMGYALAEAAVEAGAWVDLISGPVNIASPDRVNRVDVTSACQMFDAVKSLVDDSDIFIGAAAVADYRPTETASEKIKKTHDDTMEIRFTKNPDIIAWVAEKKCCKYVVGFAAETQDLLDHAKSKLSRKSLDMIVANDVADKSIGFNSDNNAVSVITLSSQTAIASMNKSALARKLIDMIAAKHQEKVQKNKQETQ